LAKFSAENKLWALVITKLSQTGDKSYNYQSVTKSGQGYEKKYLKTSGSNVKWTKLKGSFHITSIHSDASEQLF